ncbi:MAG: hypothetical protein LBQ31_08905 [Bacteroidales bacterium]|jgi:hypothetical protein|nr:hypothetical protein [Bacteroidales bacterium]
MRTIGKIAVTFSCIIIVVALTLGGFAKVYLIEKERCMLAIESGAFENSVPSSPNVATDKDTQ